MSARYSTQDSRTTTCGQHTSAFLMHSYAHNVYSFVRLMIGRLTCCLFCSQKYKTKVQPQMGLAPVTWSVDQEFQKFCGWRRLGRRWRWNDRGGGRLRETIWCGWGSVWETPDGFPVPQGNHLVWMRIRSSWGECGTSQSLINSLHL